MAGNGDPSKAARAGLLGDAGWARARQAAVDSRIHEEDASHFFGNIQLLGIPWAELELAYQKYVSGLRADAIKNKLC